MNTSIADVALAVSHSVELSLLLKGTLLLTVGLAAVRAAARSRAALRHIVLAATFGTLAALPFAATATLDIPLATDRAATAASPPAPTVAPPQGPTPQAPPAEVAGGGSANASSVPLVPWTTLARFAWAAGAILLLAQPIAVFLRLRRLRRTSIPLPDLRGAVRALAAEAGVRQPVEVVSHEEAKLPFTFGLRRPVIVLPPDAGGWSEDDLRRALVHELEHVRRGDWAVLSGARLACALWWFHPLAWAAWRRLCLEAERACDDAVVAREAGTDYAEQLVVLAKRLTASHPQPVLGMANRSDLSARVSALLDESQARGRAGFGAVTAALSGALAVLLVVAPLRAVPASGASAPNVRAVQGAQASPGTPLDRALYEAALDGDTDAVLDLLSKGANVNAPVPGDGSPLIGAVRSGNPAAVALLLDRGANPDLGVPGDGSALIAAAAGGRIDIVEMLLARGASPNLGVRGDGNPLIAASGAGRHAIVSLLLDRGADIERVVPGDENALIQAAGAGHLEVVKTLVRRGANVNARVRAAGSRAGEGEWRTPLGVARRGRHQAVVEFLVAAGARD